jgi:hypothetical protein
MDNRIRIDFPWPVKGLTENVGYSTVPTGYVLDALNVVGFDALEGRLRGGKRPGTGRAIRDPVDGVGVPIRRMKQVVLDSAEFIDAAGFFTDPFFDIGSGPTGDGYGGGGAFPPTQIISLTDTPFIPVFADPELIPPDSPDEPAMTAPTPETATPDGIAEEFPYSDGELGAVSGGNWDASGFLYQAFSAAGGFATLAGFSETLGAGQSVSVNWVPTSSGGSLPTFDFGQTWMIQAEMSVPAGSINTHLLLTLGNVTLDLEGMNGVNTFSVVHTSLPGGRSSVELPKGGDGRLHALAVLWNPTNRNFYVFWNHRLIHTANLPSGNPSFTGNKRVTATIVDGIYDERGEKIRIGNIRINGTLA